MAVKRILLQLQPENQVKFDLTIVYNDSEVMKSLYNGAMDQIKNTIFNQIESDILISTASVIDVVINKS